MTLKRLAAATCALAFVLLAIDPAVVPGAGRVASKGGVMGSASASALQEPDEAAFSHPPDGPPLGNGSVEWTLDPPSGMATIAGSRPSLGESKEVYFYNTPFGNYTFPKSSPHRLRLLASRGDAVTAWFEPVLSVKATEGTGKVDLANDTTIATTHEIIADGIAVALVHSTFVFFPDRPPKASAELTPLVEIDSLQLAWILATNETTVHAGAAYLIGFRNWTEAMALDDSDARVEIGPADISEGKEPTAWIDWSDAPEGTMAYGGQIQTTAGTVGGISILFPEGVGQVDPTVFATSTSSTATGYSSQRKILWNGERYWVFYDTGSGVGYRTTPDGLFWSDPRTVPTGTLSRGFDVDATGSTAILAWYSGNTLKFRKGTLYIDSIAWDSEQTISTAAATPPPPSVTVAGDGRYWVAGHKVYRWNGAAWEDKTTSSWNGNVGSTSAAFVLPLHGLRGATSVEGWVYAVLNFNPDPNWLQLLVGLYNLSSGGWTEHSFTLSQAAVPRYDTISAIITDTVLSLVYSGAANQNSNADVYFRQVGFTGSGFDFWADTEFLVAQGEFAPYYPSLSVGPPGKFFAFWRAKSQAEWVVRNSTGSPSAGGTWWSPPSSLFPVTPGQSPSWLSTPRTLHNRAVVAWREGAGCGSTCNLLFGVVPLTDDFGGSSAHPWARAGLSVGAPLIGELSDAVNPASGQLILRQVDAQAKGRRLDLSLTRVHTSPHAFQSGAPMFFATNPAVPIGVGWEVGFPWIEWRADGNDQVHLGDGQRYVIVWNGSKFENRAGTPFTLYNNLRDPCAGGYDLYFTDGTRLNFSRSSCVPLTLNYIRDHTGQSNVSFSYSGGRLSSLTDSMGRVATFAYYGTGTYAGYLQSLSYAGRAVSFEYTNAALGGVVLWRVTYPRGLSTTYQYDPASDYLIKTVSQPWGASTAYVYTAAPVGTDATGYFVTRQDVKDGAALVRSRTFAYALVNGWAASTNITVGDGSVAKGYQTLAFASSTRGMTTLVKDAAGTQLSKVVSWYNQAGTIGATDVYAGTASNRNYTNIAAVDNWGNPYYALTAISDLASHETFASYGNADSQNAFRAPALLRMTADGKIQVENFERLDLTPWTLTNTGGTIGLNYTVWAHAPPSMRLSRTTTGTVSGHRSFPPQSGSFFFTTSIRVGETNKDHKIFLEQGATPRVELTFAGDGNVKWRKSGGTYVSLQVYSANTWYRVGMELNTASNATVTINENRYTTGLTLYQSGTVDRVRFELTSSTSTMFVGDHALARTGSGSNPYLSFRVTGLDIGQRVDFVDPTDATVWTGPADGLGNADIVAKPHLIPAGSLKVYDAAGKEQYRSPFREFWPGSWYAYSPPYLYSGPKFYANGLSPDIHSALLGTLQWQTGRGAANPVLEESYAKYLSNGLLNATRVYHNGLPLETTYSRDTYGNVVLVKDVQGKVVRYDYGPAYSNAWTTRERWALSGGEIASRYTYNFTSGLQNSTTNPRGFTTRTAYDELGRPIEVRHYDMDPSTQMLFYDMETLTTDPTPKEQDLSGQANHGSFSGTVPSGGKVDRGRYFDGIDDIVYAPDSASLSITSSFTISAWVRYDSLGSGSSTRAIARKYDATANKGYSLEVYEGGAGGNAKKVRLLIGSGALNSYVSTGTLASPGTWYHVVAAFNDTANTVTFYINGAQSGQSTGVGVSPSDNAVPLAVGRRYDSVSLMWNGYIDEVRVFNAAISSGDAQALSALTYRQYATVLVTYDDVGRRITYQDEDGRRTRETFDSLGRRTKVERLDSLGAAYSTETFAYNWQDLVVSYTSPTLNATQRVYDALGRIVQETLPDGNVSTINYTDIANYVRVTDPSGHARSQYRDLAGHLVRAEERWAGGANSSFYVYDEVGNLVSVTDASSRRTLHTYDDLNRLNKTIYFDDRTEVYTYTDAGALSTKKARDDTVTSYAYDDLYRLTAMNVPGTTYDASYAYDANGNALTVSNGIATVTYTYDLRDRTKSERVQYVGAGQPDVWTNYTYSPAGDVQSIAYPGTPFTLSYELDEYHRAKRAYNGGTNYAQFTYMKDDAVQDITFGNGLRTSVAYDRRSRPKTIATLDGVTPQWSFAYSYDKAGNVLSLTGTGGIPSETFSYDEQDRMVRTTGTAWGTFVYTYDSVGNRACLGVGGCPVDDVPRPTAAGASAQWTKSTGCTANWDCVDDVAPDGDATRVYALAAGNGLLDLYQVSDLTQTGAINSVTVTAVAAMTWSSQCDPGCYGALKLRIYTNGAHFASDTKYVDVGWQTVSYAWTTNPATEQPWTQADVNALQAGLEKVVSTATTKVTQLYVSVSVGDKTTYAYGPMNELTSAVGREAATFTYTLNGSLATKTEGGVTWTYAYNEIGLLASVKQNAATVAQYAYDGLGRPVKAVENGVTTYFVYGLGMDPILEKSGSTETRHVYANGMRIARIVVGGATYYHHADALGSTWRITDASKATVFSTSYEPFGRSWGTTGSLASTERYRFLGERNDTESGFTYLRARQYDTKTGRFTAMDPVLGALAMPQTLNRYPYVGNNPARYTDPTGEFFFIFLLALLLVPLAVSVYGATGDVDLAVSVIGFIPIVGDIVSTAYFLARDVQDCQTTGCNWANIGLDLIGAVPGVPNFGGGARAAGRMAGLLGGIGLGGRWLNRADDVSRVVSRGDELADLPRVLRQADLVNLPQGARLPANRLPDILHAWVGAGGRFKATEDGWRYFARQGDDFFQVRMDRAIHGKWQDPHWVLEWFGIAGKSKIHFYLG